MLDNLENEIINKINKQSIKPISRLSLALKRFFVWLSVWVFLSLSGLAFSLIGIIIYYGDWDILSRRSGGLLAWFFLTFPYLWLAMLFVFAWLAWKRLKKEKYSYRHLFFWTGFFVFFIFFNAFIFWHYGFSRKVENYLAGKEGYRLANYMLSSWEDPAAGFLSGTILSLDASQFSLASFSGDYWLIDYSHSSLETELLPGKRIKVYGRMEAKDEFQAWDVRPWDCGCGRCHLDSFLGAETE